MNKINFLSLRRGTWPSLSRRLCPQQLPRISNGSPLRPPAVPLLHPTLFSSFSTTSTTMAPQEYKLKDETALSLQPGDKREVEVEGLDAKVLLVNSGGKIQAVGPKCTHYGAPLVKGVLSTNGRLTCPWHGACFNTKTGDVEDAPAIDSIPVFSVVERDGAVYLTGEEDAIKSGRRKPTFKQAAARGSTGQVVVVGGGSGAVGTVEGLREKGFQGAITVISSEGYLPIDRPKLSKALIADPSKIQLRDGDFYSSGSIEVVEDEVTGVDFEGKSVTTKKGGQYPYAKLVLATGGTPRILPLQGFKVLGNIFTLRTVWDAKSIVDAIAAGNSRKKIVVIGSSFIGMEVAGATAANNDVTVVGMEKAPLERVLGERVGNILRTGMEGKGVKFCLSAGVDKAEPSAADPSKVGAVLLQDGTKLEADLVILGVGVGPATAFLSGNKAIKLEGDGSVRTDESFSVVGVKDAYAVGDIATFPYHGPGGNGKPTRIEHWNVAQNAGRAVAGHIVDPSPPPQFFTPVFWSALHAQLRYCGNTTNGFDDVVFQGKPDEGGGWAAFYCLGETVVAVASVGFDPVVSLSAQLLRVGKMPSRSELRGGLDLLSLGPPE